MLIVPKYKCGWIGTTPLTRNHFIRNIYLNIHPLQLLVSYCARDSDRGDEPSLINMVSPINCRRYVKYVLARIFMIISIARLNQWGTHWMDAWVGVDWMAVKWGCGGARRLSGKCIIIRLTNNWGSFTLAWQYECGVVLNYGHYHVLSCSVPFLVLKC